MNIFSDENLKLIAAFFCGGLGGAIFTFFVTEYRNRVQPVAVRASIDEIDIDTIMPNFPTSITMTVANGDKSYSQQFRKLSVVRVSIANMGNKDFATFDFGVNLPASVQAIGHSVLGQDRMHKVSSDTVASIDSPLSQFDFTLTPFNRGNQYNVSIVTFGDSPVSAKDISFASPESVRLINSLDSENLNATIEETAELVGTFIFPVRVALQLRRIFLRSRTR